MTAQTSSTNKSRFEQGDRPQGSDYVDLIDSFVANTDSTAQSIVSNLTVPTLFATHLNAPTASISALSIGTITSIYVSADTFLGGTFTGVGAFTTVDATFVSANRLYGETVTLTGVVSAPSLNAATVSAGSVITSALTTYAMSFTAITTSLTTAQTTAVFATGATLGGVRLVEITINGSAMFLPVFRRGQFT